MRGFPALVACVSLVAACGTEDLLQLDGGALRLADAGDPDAGFPVDGGDVDAGSLDAGVPDAGGLDAGDLDAGDLDAGTLDGGDPDAGDLDGGGVDASVPRLQLTTVGATSPPDEMLGTANGLPGGVRDASHDIAGNLWAVNADRIFVRRAGLGAFESFGPENGLDPDELLGVGGGLAGVAWVGHRGEGDADEDPEWMKDTGGVSKIELDGADVRITHVLLRSPPGRYPDYPNGRAKLRSCYRAYVVKTGPHAGDAWFGCNHGVGQFGIDYGMQEHHHPNKCLWDPVAEKCTMKTGDVPAIAFTAGGDLWFGGSYGVMLLDYSTGARPGKFWGPEPVRNLPLFPAPLKPNAYGSEDLSAVAVAADGSLWAASEHSGLAHRLEDGRVDIYQEVDGLPSNEITDLAIDASNRLWIATAKRGLWRMDLATGVIEQADGLPSGLCMRVVAEPTPGGERITAVCRGTIAIWNGGAAAP